MSVNVVLNGQTYTIPEPGDTAWGQNVTDYLVALGSGVLQKAGGSFFLTAEVDFGASYGLKSIYFKSRTTNVSTAGVLRLASTDSIGWRNNAASGNVLLAKDTSDNLTYNGHAFVTSAGAITGDSPVFTGTISGVNMTLSGTLAVTSTSSFLDNVSISKANEAGLSVTSSAGSGVAHVTLNSVATAQGQVRFGTVANPLQAKILYSDNSGTFIIQTGGTGTWGSGTISNALTITAAQAATFAGTLAVTGSTALAAVTATSGLFTGFVGVGSSLPTDTALRVSKNITGAASAYGVAVTGEAQSDATNAVRVFWSQPNLVAGLATTTLAHFSAEQGTFGAGSSAGSQFGFRARASLTSGTSNYGFYSEIPAASGRWAFFDAGGADSALAGNLRIGSNVAPTKTVDITGTLAVSGVITASNLSASLPVKTDGSKNLVSGAINLASATEVTGALAAANFPALTGDVTTTAGSLATTIGASKVTNSMLAGSIAASKLVGSDIATVGTVTAGTWNATAIGAAYGGTGGSSAASSGIAHVAAGVWSYSSIVNADVSNSAAIAYSKLALTGSILNADLAGSIAASKLILTDITTLSNLATVGTITSGVWNAGAVSSSGALSITGTSLLTGNVGIGAASSSQSQLLVTSQTTVTGTNSNSASGTTVTGVGTLYKTEFRVGDTITMNGETRTISAIASDTSLTTDAWTGANSGVAATRAAVPHVYVYPNGILQVGGTRTTIGTNGFSTNSEILAVSSAATTSSSATPTAGLVGLSYTGANAAGSALTLAKARGTEASPDLPSSSDTLGQILFRGWTASGTFTTGGLIAATATETWSSTAAGTRLIFQTTPKTTTTNATTLTLDSEGSVILGKTAALSTSATDGFAYMPTCAGTPSGTPTAFTGKVAFVYDTTNNKIYIYNGSWRGVTVT